MCKFDFLSLHFVTMTVSADLLSVGGRPRLFKKISIILNTLRVHNQDDFYWQLFIKLHQKNLLKSYEKTSVRKLNAVYCISKPGQT